MQPVGLGQFCHRALGAEVLFDHVAPDVNRRPPLLRCLLCLDTSLCSSVAYVLNSVTSLSAPPSPLTSLSAHTFNRGHYLEGLIFTNKMADMG